MSTKDVLIILSAASAGLIAIFLTAWYFFGLNTAKTVMMVAALWYAVNVPRLLYRVEREHVAELIEEEAAEYAEVVSEVAERITGDVYVGESGSSTKEDVTLPWKGYIVPPGHKVDMETGEITKDPDNPEALVPYLVAPNHDVSMQDIIREERKRNPPTRKRRKRNRRRTAVPAEVFEIDEEMKMLFFDIYGEHWDDTPLCNKTKK